MARQKKYVYYFGGGSAEGDGKMKELLGGKGANLAEMCLLGIPVPAGFTLSTEVCTYYYDNNQKYPSELKEQVEKAVAKVEREMKHKFGDVKNPLLLSVRSGARASMPGMMETVLNIGLTTKTIPGLVLKSNERFVWDSYRRLIMMYSDVVMEKAAGIEPKDGEGIRHQLEHILAHKKEAVGAKVDTDLSTADLQELCAAFKDRIKKVLGKEFPDDANEQLWGGINAVFRSWNGKRAKEYRRIERIPDEWGTAVNVQAMVFGNLGDTSSTGVAFTRDPSTGANEFYGEYLVNAQGEDVVAGIRTPSPILKKYENKERGDLSLQRKAPAIFNQLNDIRLRLEKHYKDMLDIEFTIEDNVLYMLQCRVGKRNGTAAVRMAVEMLEEGLIDEKTAIMRVRPTQLNELLLPSVNPDAERKGVAIATGLPAGPGGATGQIVFTADDAEKAALGGKKVILVRAETSPEDVAGMHSAEAILTARGGMTSHAALVARGWGKCCIVGCSALAIDTANRKMVVNGKTYVEGDYITLNGTKGTVYEGQLKLDLPDLEKNKYYRTLMKVADKYRQIGVRTNCDSGPEAVHARSLGAQGIGLCRTEHMFFDSKRIKAVREMIVAKNHDDRKRAIDKLLPFQRQDFVELFTAMEGLPVTIRLIDPPLHEFTPNEAGQIDDLSKELGITSKDLAERIQQLHEANPMLGHRGCRLGITYPEIIEMQARAVFEAAAEVQKKKKKVLPEVMVPLVGNVTELRHQAAIIHQVAAEVQKAHKLKLDYMVGTMIELPRAALTADQIAGEAAFFSFGTNDLTQTTLGISRDDMGTFLPDYLSKKIFKDDPFQTLDQEGVGQLIDLGIKKGRSVRNDLKVGICGEHGGDPASVEFCHRVGMNYVSCSPFRVPIARFAAAQAAIQFPRGAAAAAPAKAEKKAAAKPAKAEKAVKAPKAAKAAAKPAAKPAKPAKAEKKVAAAKPAKAEKKAAAKPAKAEKKAAKKGKK